jgi:hypothetical protein
LIVAAGAVSAILVVLPASRGRRLALAGAGLGLAAMLAGPAAYTLDTVATAYTGSIVSAGPAATTSDLLSGSSAAGPGGQGSGGPGGTFAGGVPGGNLPGLGGSPPGAAGIPPIGRGAPTADGSSAAQGGPGLNTDKAADATLASYLVANRASATWIVAVSTATEAANLELETGLPVMAMGGWNGSDNALTLEQLQADVASGTLRYVILGGQGGGPGLGQGGSSEIDAWVSSHGAAVTVPGSSVTLYDLSGAISSGA